MPKPGKTSAKNRFFLYNNVSRRFVEIHDGFLCGRLEGDLQFPDDKAVSRKQCQFSISGNDVYIEDLGSTNRTKVNAAPAESGHRRRIQLYDVIEFGSQRLILSHQDKFPANVQDRINSGKLYRAFRRDDGQLTSEIAKNQDMTKRTLVLLDKATFRKLRLEETFSRDRRKKKRSSSSGRAAAQTDRSHLWTWILALLVLVCWLGPIASLWVAGALDSGLPGEATEIVLGLAVMLAIGGVLALGLYLRMLRSLVQGPVGRGIVVFLLTLGTIGTGVFLTKKTGLLTRASLNLAVARCVRVWDPDVCQTLSALDHQEWVRFPADLRAHIDSKLHH
jgi:hypothetical protein